MLRALLLLTPLIALPATAQEIPACNQSRAGAVACMSGKLCSCNFQRGGTIAGRPDGYRWDCGILRPGCGEALAPPGVQQPQVQLPQLYLNVPAPEETMPPRTPWPR
jgi:hypothetical protein